MQVASSSNKYLVWTAQVVLVVCCWLQWCEKNQNHHFPNEGWWTFKVFSSSDTFQHKSDNYFLRSHRVEHYPPNINVTLHCISLKEIWLCPFKVALSWKLWGSQDGKERACWRSESGHITGLKGVWVCVSLPSTANLCPRTPPLWVFCD